MTLSERSSLAKKLALDCGFTLAGTASLDHQPARLGFLSEWLAEGYAGEMAYLKRQEAKRLDPGQVLPGARSMLCVALLYNTDQPFARERKGEAWISRYAWGEDYHKILEKKLEVLEKKLKEAFGPEIRTKAYVDTGPVAEKAWAAAAGIGWIGKNTCLIHPKLGSWLFLGEILTDLELSPDAPAADLCGSCRKCLDICPTQAFPKPYVLDASRCVSYLTIEKRGEIAADLQPGLGTNLYGCDLCQEVCPWNHWDITTSEPAFQPREGNLKPDLGKILSMDPAGFAEIYAGSPMKRTKLEGMQRNARIVLKNRGVEEWRSGGAATDFATPPPLSPSTPQTPKCK
jgi:epoxyqueuosine reductase